MAEAQTPPLGFIPAPGLEPATLMSENNVRIQLTASIQLAKPLRQEQRLGFSDDFRELLSLYKGTIRHNRYSTKIKALGDIGADRYIFIDKQLA